MNVLKYSLSHRFIWILRAQIIRTAGSGDTELKVVKDFPMRGFSDTELHTTNNAQYWDLVVDRIVKNNSTKE